uniref:Uncharacterized protein n=1 Tax=Pseudo-nitzschia australis TaxID=44445 RepID=A0A7S4A8K8_9STRA|mmetsp:Transcript_27597/g.60774  ORF Transcript_27597/g.60774 Transcript_27597/m.60774 type:complete len:355 (+) Transcript_27597:275-1339(+)
MPSSAANTRTDDGDLSESSPVATSDSTLATQQQQHSNSSRSFNMIFNCTTNEEQQAKAIKDGNDAVLKQFEIKKIQMEYSKGQARRGSKSLSNMNISIANVDWSGFSGAAHNSIRSGISTSTTTNNNNTPSHRKTRKSRRKSLQPKSPDSSNSVPEKNQQTNTTNANDTDSTSTGARIEKLRISRRRQLHVADKDGSTISSARLHSTTSSETPFGKSPNVNAEQKQKKCLSRRSMSRTSLMADLTPLPSSSASQVSNFTNYTRGSRSIKTKPKRKPKTPAPSALASKLNSSNKRSSRSSVTIASSHSRDLAAASTTFEISEKRSSLLRSKSFSRQRRQEDVMGSQLKKQSSIKW